jgi:tripeptide aminopeptidase
MEFHSMLPPGESPEQTEGYEGFYHLLSINGDVEQTKLHYIIRDFDKENFSARKAEIEAVASKLKGKYGDENIILDLKDQYYNMKDKIESVKEIVEIAQKAMENLGIKPIIKPIRGGTDGSQLSYMGLPTPNIFAGGENFHGRFEFTSAENMEKAVNVIVEIVKLYGQK